MLKVFENKYENGSLRLQVCFTERYEYSQLPLIGHDLFQ